MGRLTVFGIGILPRGRLLTVAADFRPIKSIRTPRISLSRAVTAASGWPQSRNSTERARAWPSAA